MAQHIINFLNQASRARTKLIALSASASLIAFSSQSEQQASLWTRSGLPGLIPVSLADTRVEVQQSIPTIALSGFEDVKDVNGFVTTALTKALKHQKNSPLQSLVSLPKDACSANSSLLRFGEQPRVPTLEPAAFYAQLEKQPLSEKIMILDDIVDSVILEAQRSAEVSGLTVGMLGGGVACYALLGWWSDLALPGVGTVACSAVAGAAGHNRAKIAAKRTRTRLLNAILESQPASGGPLRNSFVDYLTAPSLDVKQRIASDTKPAVLFRDFYLAVQPLLKQVPAGGSGDAQELVMSTAA